MCQSIDLRRRLVFGLVCICVLLGIAGCDSGTDTESQASRDHVDAMAREHANDTSDASDGARIAPRYAVISERLPYAEVNDQLVYGYFVFPSDMVEPLPAVIVIHEWWGLNDNVRAMADRLASEGYIVLAVDLYAGKTATNAEVARHMMLSVVENTKAATQNIRKAYQFVSETAGAPRIGSLGWCFGGGWSLTTAMLFPDDLDATVIYYGRVTDDEEKLRPMMRKSCARSMSRYLDCSAPTIRVSVFGQCNCLKKRLSGFVRPMRFIFIRERAMRSRIPAVKITTPKLLRTPGRAPWNFSAIISSSKQKIPDRRSRQIHRSQESCRPS